MAAGEAFSFVARQRIDQAVAAFGDQTGMHASVYVGSADTTDVAAFADAALAALPVEVAGTVLLVVDPGRRQTVIRTDDPARSRLSDEACALATLSMTTSFGAGDLVGGLVVGLRMLADSTTPATDLRGRPAPTSSTVTHR